MRFVIVGGSDAGIAAGLRASELDPSVEVTVVLADAYPNFSICGLPYLHSGEVTDWRTLAHRDLDTLQSAGLDLQLEQTASSAPATSGWRWPTPSPNAVSDLV